jgi:hypothetical protein
MSMIDKGPDKLQHQVVALLEQIECRWRESLAAIDHVRREARGVRRWGRVVTQ